MARRRTSCAPSPQLTKLPPTPHDQPELPQQFAYSEHPIRLRTAIDPDEAALADLGNLTLAPLDAEADEDDIPLIAPPRQHLATDAAQLKPRGADEPPRSALCCLHCSRDIVQVQVNLCPECLSPHTCVKTDDTIANLCIQSYRNADGTPSHSPHLEVALGLVYADLIRHNMFFACEGRSPCPPVQEGWPRQRQRVCVQ
jgi:hypothetical protein